MTVKRKRKKSRKIYRRKHLTGKKAIVTIDTAASEKTYTAKGGERKQNFLRV